MTPHYIIQALFVVGGAVALLAALFNWEWFFTAHNTQAVVRAVGRGRARWFYGLLGLLCIALAIYFFTETYPQG